MQRPGHWRTRQSYLLPEALYAGLALLDYLPPGVEPHLRVGACPHADGVVTPPAPILLYQHYSIILPLVDGSVRADVRTGRAEAVITQPLCR